ncbi:carbohydrate ABC transporter substrate-binding protein (CUT1 family) [Kineothrix alysoides]|uniref:Carbohydrate ABC transporter substrate-binding protein (CUT1 family) n=1 Tax=Kineothrix alysoides TaxID=1469948 RepID=A0A4R1QM34_9FIRM|nr:extracellular solute-binding protein [Kineothrix alysoides]TCL54779.1 carbohydrate ABC transporter substrate-binding protein (CUT1 family) [Kineothrix alysoides]
MKKKLLATILSVALTASMLAGCGSNAGTSGTTTGDAAAETTTEAEAGDDAAATEEGEVAEGEAAPAAVTTVGDPNGTHMEMWSFVELHNTFYASMLEKWNAENPDRTIEITFTTYPYADMHTKLLTSLNAGTGAPDLCDVEVGQFPNVVAGMDTWLYPLDDALAPYAADLVQARLDTYAGADGKHYGAPTHVGATVMYYNAELLESYGIDYTTIKTWDDYTAAGEKLKEASDGKVMLTSVDTAGVDWMWVAMAEYGEDWTGGFDGSANVQLESVKNMLTMQQGWLDSGIAMVSPDGHVDLEAGFQNILDGNIASFPKALWYMSRFLNYMPEEAGKWALAPCPVFEAGQPRSVGIGGTGTVVTNQSVDTQLAADFISYAKCSEEGAKGIWETLGFDVCNSAMWTDESITHDSNNEYVKFFRTNPYDVLNEVKDEIGKISVVAISPTINEQMCNVTLNDVLENKMDVDEALQAAQDVISLEE